MTDEEHLTNGLEILKRMVGAEEAERFRAGWRKLSPDLERFILGFVAGQIWTRSAVELKTRSLCTVAALTALGRTSALDLNVRMALGNGATKTEIIEVILHMAPYAGFPAVWDGLNTAARIFDELQSSRAP
jgi:4-carboxymuconolactone decarboxylase